MEIPLPPYLNSPHALGLLGPTPNQPVAQFELGDYRNFVYLIIDWETRRVAMVDSRPEWQPILEVLENHQLTLESLFLTHTHYDHTPGIPQLLTYQPELKIYLHERDSARLLKTLPLCEPHLDWVQNGDWLEVGKTRVQALHTPGHSPGALCYFVPRTQESPPFLLTGDTLFIGDCGRTDLPGGSTRELFTSLRQLSALDPACIILPGHHYAVATASTLAWELAHNPPLRAQSVEELEALP